MVKWRKRTIVSILSVGGRRAFPFGTLYHGTKFAVEGLSESLQYELRPLGIRVKLVKPGGIQTNFGGRSRGFSNDPALTEYQLLVHSVPGGLGPLMAQGSLPTQIAQVVYNAAPDDTSPFRYEAGADDATFFAGLQAQFGLGS